MPICSRSRFFSLQPNLAEYLGIGLSTLCPCGAFDFNLCPPWQILPKSLKVHTQMHRYGVRFSGIRRLYSTDGLERLRRAHVCVIGVGGVGSWTVEALARSGVGALTLVDMDDICVSNVNRQIHAVDSEIHKPKVESLAARVLAINPACQVHPVRAFLVQSNAHMILERGYDYVFDAIDAVREKALCLSLCRQLRLPVLTSGGAGGRRDPTQVCVDDLSRATNDR